MDLNDRDIEIPEMTTSTKFEKSSKYRSRKPIKNLQMDEKHQKQIDFINQAYDEIVTNGRKGNKK